MDTIMHKSAEAGYAGQTVVRGFQQARVQLDW